MDLVQSQTQSYSDESLCRLAASGDPLAETELVGRYTRLVRVCARPLFLAGGDSEDLIQEICVRSRLYAAVRAAQRDKHFPLNHSVSFETPLFDGTSAHLFSSEESPEDVVIGREELRERLDALKGQLSGFEAEILSYYLGGLSCAEIASQVGRSTKSVDNAVQRIRRKVARQLSSGDLSKS